jgi:hypothetical protein
LEKQGPVAGTRNNQQTGSRRRNGIRRSNGSLSTAAFRLGYLRRSDFISDELFELIQPFVEGRGHGNDRSLTDFALELLEVLFRGGLIHFVGCDKTRALYQAWIIELKLLEELSIIVPGCASVCSRHVEKEDQHAATLDVPQKGVAQAHVLVRALD